MSIGIGGNPHKTKVEIARLLGGSNKYFTPRLLKEPFSNIDHATFLAIQDWIEDNQFKVYEGWLLNAKYHTLEGILPFIASDQEKVSENGQYVFARLKIRNNEAFCHTVFMANETEVIKSFKSFFFDEAASTIEV